MKAIQFINPLIFLFCIIACANSKQEKAVSENNVKDTLITTTAVATDTVETGKLITYVSCKADPSQSYALYIPATGNQQALPVVYFFDPHGDGSLPLAKYKTLANNYHFILAGSNNSKNGNDGATTENIWRALFDDTQKRLKINTNRIYTVGFSGGAKAAGQVALTHHEVKAVIANGAGLPDGTPAGNFNFTFTAIAGEGDMNMTDLVSFDHELDKTQTRHRIIFFDGKHEWAPANTMNIAFAGLQLDAMREKIISADDVFIRNYISGSKKEITDYSASNNYIKAEAACKLSISLLDGLAGNTPWFKEKEASLKKNPVYQKQWQAKQNLLVTEQNLKSSYMQQFQQGDINYWTKTISDLQTNAKTQTAEGAMYQRLLAYLSLAFYSISNRFITGNRNKEAQYFVELYKKVDATNSEAWYFSAILNARNINAKATNDDLLKAVANGFADKNRMMQQPEFQYLGTQINLPQIISQMK